MNHLNKNANILGYLSMVALGMYLAAYQYALTDISAEYALQGWGTGLVIAMHFVVSFFLPPFAGEIADRVGRKPVLLIAFACFAGGMFCVALADGILLLSLGALVAGGGSCTIESSMSSLLSQQNPGQEKRVMNLSQMYFCAGALVSPLYGELLARFGVDWRGIYGTAVAVALLCGIAVARVKLPPPPPRQEGLYLGRVLRRPYYLFLLAAMFLYVGVEESAGFWAGTYVEEGLAGAVPKAYVLAAYWAGMAAGRLVANGFINRLGWITVAGLGAGALCLGGTLVFTGPAAYLLCYLGVGLGLAPAWPMLMASATRYCRDVPDTAAGGVMAAGAAGGMALPLLIGFVQTAADIRGAFILLAVITALLVLLLGASRRFRSSR